MTRAAQLRERLAEPGIVVMPGIHDALSAKFAEQAGARVVNIGGSMVANAILGLPDVGLATMTEVAEQVRRVTAATTIPGIVDADTGYGNAINVGRTVREFEAAGAAGLYMEDQTFPKKCGHFSGKQVIDTDEMLGKLRAALDARRDDDFVIIARTDANTVLGFDEAVERANRYGEAGADVVFFEAPASEDELRRVPELVEYPVLVNMVSGGGRTPLKSAAELEAMGWKIVNFGAAALQVAMRAVADFFDELLRDGSVIGYQDRLMSFEERQRRLGLDEIYAAERRYGTPNA